MQGGFFFFSWFHVSSNNMLHWRVGKIVAYRPPLSLCWWSVYVSGSKDPSSKLQCLRSHRTPRHRTWSSICTQTHMQSGASPAEDKQLSTPRSADTSEIVQVTGWTLTSQELLGKTQSTFHKDAQHRVKFLPNSYRAIFYFFLHVLFWKSGAFASDSVHKLLISSAWYCSSKL